MLAMLAFVNNNILQQKQPGLSLIQQTASSEADPTTQIKNPGRIFSLTGYMTQTIT